MTLKVMREEGGVRGLYRGLVATAMGVAPYVGINFAAYEALRGIITPPGKVTVARKLACGALAGESVDFATSFQGKKEPELVCVIRIDITDIDLSIRRAAT
jgi:Mitochondrial carrier protein